MSGEEKGLEYALESVGKKFHGIGARRKAHLILHAICIPNIYLKPYEWFVTPAVVYGVAFEKGDSSLDGVKEFVAPVKG